MSQSIDANTSRISGFHKWSAAERIARVAAAAGLSDAEQAQLAAPSNIP